MRNEGGVTKMRNLQVGIFVAALAATRVLAQDISGTIEGSVLDKSQGAIAKARVTVTNVDRNQTVDYDGRKRHLQRAVDPDRQLYGESGGLRI